MSINMADVKQIINNANNKEVVKIEDSLGNVLWQKASQVKKYLYKVTITYVGTATIYNNNHQTKTLTATMYSETSLNGTRISLSQLRSGLLSAGLISASNANSFNIMSFVNEPSTGYFILYSNKYCPIYQIVSNSLRAYNGTSTVSLNAQALFTVSSELVEVNADTLWFGATNQRDGAGIASLGWAVRLYSTNLGHTFNNTTDYDKLEVTNFINNSGVWSDPTNIIITGYTTDAYGTYTFSNNLTKTQINYNANQLQVVELHPFTV